MLLAQAGDHLSQCHAGGLNTSWNKELDGLPGAYDQNSLMLSTVLYGSLSLNSQIYKFSV